MRVLIACEESQAVTKEFRSLGIKATSCDLDPCSGGHPEWHIQRDVLTILHWDWDMILAFPPCTHLCVSGARWFKDKIADGRQQGAIDFFMNFANSKCERVVIENPIGIMSSKWRKPDQIIQPYEFGHPYSKATCLWIKGLPMLVPTEVVPVTKDWNKETFNIPKKDRAKERSKTFKGIALAMAKQWGIVS